MNKFFTINKNILGIALTGLISLSASAVRAESAVRGAFAEVRANGSSQSASFEHILPENFYFGAYSVDAASGAETIGSTLTISVSNPGTNESNIDSLSINAGPALSTSSAYDGTASTALTSIEAAIADQIKTTTGVSAEDITGYIRAFAGADGASLD